MPKKPAVPEFVEPAVHPFISEAWVPGVPTHPHLAESGDSVPPEPEPVFVPNPPRPAFWWTGGVPDTAPTEEA